MHPMKRNKESKSKCLEQYIGLQHRKTENRVECFGSGHLCVPPFFAASIFRLLPRMAAPVPGLVGRRKRESHLPITL